MSQNCCRPKFLSAARNLECIRPRLNYSAHKIKFILIIGELFYENEFMETQIREDLLHKFQ